MKKYLTFIIAIFITTSLFSQDKEEQSRESQAMDATATQWSFQLAYQWMPQYYDDIVDGESRQPGLDNYAQLRIVAPIPLKGLTILPRLTFRHYEDLTNGQSGCGKRRMGLWYCSCYSKQ